MKKILLWLWQLPQNLIGFIYSRFAKKASAWYFKGKYALVYFVPCFKAGVTLGQYIILDPIYKRLSSGKLLETVQHEYGHSVQSKYLGWFYLLVVGLPSIFRNILSRINPKKFNVEWYYSGYPEFWADKLGGVRRMTEFEIKNSIQNAIKHWLSPTDCGVIAIRLKENKLLVAIEWSDGISIFDCDKVLALIKDKQKISKDDLIDYCSI